VELRHLRYFVTLAEELHFGRAAKRLNISQPPLSQQIRNLEEELGAQLFHRTKRKVQLSEAGARFVEEARQVIAHVDRAARVVSRVKDGEVGSLVVGTVTSEKRIVIRCLKEFSKRYPDVHIDLRSLGTAAQLLALHEGRLHVGFLIPPLDDANLAVEIVAREPLVVALPRGHRLAAQQRIPLRALAGESSILMPRALSPGYYDQIVSVCRNAGFSLHMVHQADNIYTALALVAAGLGVSLFPASMQDGKRRDIVFRELRPALPQVECAAVHDPNNRSAVLASFLKVVRSVARGD